MVALAQSRFSPAAPPHTSSSSSIYRVACCRPAYQARVGGREASKFHVPMRYCNPQFNVVVAIKWKLYLTWPPSKERVTVDVELASLPFPARAAESIDRRTDPNVDESELFQHFLPGCARQTTGNSGRPKIDISDRRFGHRLAVRNVGELQAPAWA